MLKTAWKRFWVRFPASPTFLLFSLPAFPPYFGTFMYYSSWEWFLVNIEAVDLVNLSYMHGIRYRLDEK